MDKLFYVSLSIKQREIDMNANYRIQTSEGKFKFTGNSETGSWFFLQDARNLVDYNEGEKIVKEIVFGVYAEVM